MTPEEQKARHARIKSMRNGVGIAVAGADSVDAVYVLGLMLLKALKPMGRDDRMSLFQAVCAEIVREIS